MDEKTFHATVAERAGLSKEEIADLTRATLEALAGQISGGGAPAARGGAAGLAGAPLPPARRTVTPKQLTDFVRELSRGPGSTRTRPGAA